MTYAEAVTAIKSEMGTAKGAIANSVDSLMSVTDGSAYLSGINTMLNDFNSISQKLFKYECMSVPSSGT